MPDLPSISPAPLLLLRKTDLVPSYVCVSIEYAGVNVLFLKAKGVGSQGQSYSYEAACTGVGWGERREGERRPEVNMDVFLYFFVFHEFILYSICLSVCLCISISGTLVSWCTYEVSSYGNPSVLPLCGFWGLNSQVVKLGGKHLYAGRHLTGP